MNKKVLFIGTYLSEQRGSISIAEKLARKFERHEMVEIRLVSKFRFKPLRLLDIAWKILFSEYSQAFIDTYSGQSFLITRWAAFFLHVKNRPYTIVIRGGNFVQFFTQNQEKVESVLRRANDIICPSKYLKTFFETKDIQVEYIPNFIDTDRFPFGEHLRRNEHTLLWVRAFGTVYNPGVALQVVAELRSRYPDVRLTMVGPDLGLQSTVNDQITEMKLEDYVVLTGPVANEDLYKFYQSHAVYLNTTSYESFGAALLEAASCGIPIVSSNVGEIPFMYQENRDIFLVDDFSIADYVEKVSALFDSKELQIETGLNGKEVASSFDFNPIKRSWELEFSKFNRLLELNSCIGGVLFVGSFLSKTKGSLGASESLMFNLRKDGLSCRLTSRAQKKTLRMADITFNLLRSRAKVVHIDVFSGQNFFIAAFASSIAKLFRKKVVLTLHGGKLPEFFSANRVLVRKTFRKANALVTPSNYLRTFFHAHGFDISYIPNSINLGKFPFHSDRPVGPLKILWVRAFGEIYQPKMAVDVLRLIKDKYPDATLTMVGPDIGMRTETKRYINKLGLQDSVFITGYVDNKLLKDYYHSHTVYVNTTKFESFGISVLEAASCGIPIVSNNVGEIPQMWKHNFDILITKLNDVPDMAFQVMQVYENETLSRKLVANARLKSESFSWNNIKERWYCLIESLC
ncbi:MAG: glycosyltransferase family 4 protein [Ferruginibacter sp.]|nr:glycosyltransferase family 4 protein [Ferruginibacter sp.]